MSASNEIIELSNIYSELSHLIKTTKQKIQYNINSDMILLYWNIGKKIRLYITNQQKAQYGKEVVTKLSKQLSSVYGRGYSRRNLFNMIKIFDFFPEIEIVQTLSAQLSWSHILEIMKIDDNLKREFYTSLCMHEHWSVRDLRGRISSMLFERTSLSQKPSEVISNDLDMLKNKNKFTTDIVLRDPYILDFLELQDTYSEKDLERAILAELERFLLELGRDFSFIGRQVRITIDEKDYYIDLLFYHRKLRRLVLIELKLGEFKPEHKGQVELYLRWLDKYEKYQDEDSPLAIILCAQKSNETVELLELDKSGIHVAQYLTSMPPKSILAKKLSKAIENAKKRLDLDHKND